EDSPCIDAGTPDTTGFNLPPWDIIGNLRIWDGDGNGSAIIDMGAYEYGAPPYVDVENNIVVQTPELFLYQNYPNPFNPNTTINYQLPAVCKVQLSIYNIKGEKVKTLVKDKLEEGKHIAIWDGKDEQNKPVSSGIYFYKLKTGENSMVRKMILLR
ncbi:MAG: T9SS type A sorting domain-containing protein, partial [Candidatus Cloacimonetes bacterium]|nr:T9SS type A sorting domain-containing protein [Candidatus Cloacimonadota bacterium]